MVIACKMYSFRNTTLLYANLIISLLRKRGTSVTHSISTGIILSRAESSNNVIREREWERGGRGEEGGEKESNNLVKRNNTSRLRRNFQRYLTIIVRYIFVELRCAKCKDSLSLKLLQIELSKKDDRSFQSGRPRWTAEIKYPLCGRYVSG